MTEFRLIGERSVVLIEARSSVGPIAFAANVVEGIVWLALKGSDVELTAASTASLSIKLGSFTSGNTR